MRAFIFDFDGVIADSQRHWDERGLSLYQQFMPHWTEQEHLKLKGLSEFHIYDVLVRDYGFTMPKSEYLGHIEAFAEQLYSQYAEAMPGIQALLDRLTSLEIPMAIASSGRRPWIEKALQRNGLSHYFTAIASGEDVPGKWKPEPDVYLIAASRLGVDPKQCVGMEDSSVGLRAIKAANMYAIALDTPYNSDQDFSIADKHIKHFEELDRGVLHGWFA